jgi:hypothetical protein
MLRVIIIIIHHNHLVILNNHCIIFLKQSVFYFDHIEIFFVKVLLNFHHQLNNNIKIIFSRELYNFEEFLLYLVS